MRELRQPVQQRVGTYRHFSGSARDELGELAPAGAVPFETPFAPAPSVAALDPALRFPPSIPGVLTPSGVIYYGSGYSAAARFPR